MQLLLWGRWLKMTRNELWRVRFISLLTGSNAFCWPTKSICCMRVYCNLIHTHHLPTNEGCACVLLRLLGIDWLYPYSSMLFLGHRIVVHVSVKHLWKNMGKYGVNPPRSSYTTTKRIQQYCVYISCRLCLSPIISVIRLFLLHIFNMRWCCQLAFSVETQLITMTS